MPGGLSAPEHSTPHGRTVNKAGEEETNLQGRAQGRLVWRFVAQSSGRRPVVQPGSPAGRSLKVRRRRNGAPGALSGAGSALPRQQVPQRARRIVGDRGAVGEAEDAEPQVEEALETGTRGRRILVQGGVDEVQAVRVAADQV